MRWNFKMSTIDGMLANVSVGMVTPFLAILAIALGGSNTVVGLVTAVPALINTVMYLPAAAMVESARGRLGTVVAAATGARLLYLVMAAVPFLPWPERRAAILVCLIGLQAIPAVISALAWTALMGETFPQEERARVFAFRSMYCSLVALASSMVAGLLLDRVEYPWNYLVLFTISYVAAMTSLHFLMQMKEFPTDGRKPGRTSVVDRLRKPFTDPEYGVKFRVFTMSAFVLHIGLNLAIPVYPIYHVRVLELSNSVIASFSVASGLSAVLAYPIWGGIARRAGNAVVYFLSGLAFAVFPTAYYLAGQVPYLFALQVFVGFFNAGWALTLFNLMLEYVDPEESANGIAVFNMVINVTGILAPFVAAHMISVWGVGVPFAVASAIRLLGCLLFLRAAHPGALVARAARIIRTASYRRQGLNRNIEEVS